MYSTRVIERNIRTIEQKTALKLTRYEPQVSEEWTKFIDALWIPADKRTSRPLTTEESKFVANEQIMCQLDFRYWAERYCQIRLDGAVGGGVGKMKLGDSQILLLDLIAKIHEKQYQAHDRGEPVDGILIADHKARQVWHTALARALCLHRATLYPHANIFAGSVDDQKLGILYDRDTMSYEDLPWFLRPERGLGEKTDHMGFKNGSKITYMASNKKSSFGQGDQFNVGHCTELSEYPYPGVLEIDFFPTLPQHPDTLCVLESRANGRGNWWHTFSEDCRRGKKERWAYSFCPWYTESRKYRRTPKAGWEPDEVAILHGKKIYETSVEFTGKRVSVSKEQLYWWWSTREEYRVAGRLNYFLSNYCATPEESFQHSGESAFDPELLDDLRLRAKPGKAYELERKAS